MSEIDKLAEIEITKARIDTYEGFYSNEIEGDFGTWDDWKKLLISFGTKIKNNYIPTPEEEELVKKFNSFLCDIEK